MNENRNDRNLPSEQEPAAESQRFTGITHVDETKRGKRFSPPLSPELVKFFLPVILVIGSVLLFVTAADTMSKSARDAYDNAKEENRRAAYNDLYNRSYDSAERKLHVSNNIAISITEMQEMAELEIMRVSDVEYVIMDEEDTSENITCWVEVPGTGVFTVNLASGEYIVDSQRQYVLVRVPRPVLSEFTVEYADVQRLFWKDGIFDGSIKAGEGNRAQEQTNQGALLLKQYMSTNREIYESVTASALDMIESLIRQLNPDVPDMTVEIEFLDGI